MVRDFQVRLAGVPINMNPYQGLKHQSPAERGIPSLEADVPINMNPYQGLKQTKMARVAITYVPINMNPYQGLKPLGIQGLFNG